MFTKWFSYWISEVVGLLGAVRANEAEPRMSREAFVMLLLLVTARLELMLIDVFGQKKMNIIACIPIRREDDNQHAQFKTAQQLLNKDMMTKELKSSFSKAKQIVCIWRLQQKELRLEKSKCEVKNARLNHCYLHSREQIVVVADLQSLAAVVVLCIEFGLMHWIR